jgi:hypothetical protein
MKGSVARKIRQEMEKYRQQPNTPIVPLHDRVFSPLGVKGEVLVPVNHTRRAKREIQRVGDLNKGISNYGKGLVKTIDENREAQGDINALDKLAQSRQEKKARKMSRGAIASAMKKKPKEEVRSRYDDTPIKPPYHNDEYVNLTGLTYEDE